VTLTDYAKAHVREVVPYIVGLVVAFAARHDVKIDAQAMTFLSFAVGTVYYAVVRLLERYVTPRFGWLLGLAQQPVYAKVRTLKAKPAHVVSLPIVTIVTPELPSKHGGRLGRHVEHDERSRAYAVAPHPAPKTVRWHRHVHPFDQGDLGSCTGNAMAGALSTRPFPHRFAEATAVTLYKAATHLDDVPGAWPPDDTGSTGLAVAKAAVARGWIRSYLHCFSLDDVLSALQDGPCIAGTNWYSGMDTPDADGLAHVTGTVRGGHEYELVGVDMERQRILAVNSWGMSWGRSGYFDIGFADFARLLAEQGDVTVPKL
jgi:hypothetical protein